MNEDQSVREVYDRIADHFSQTREYPWPEVTDFLQTEGGGRGIDLGCGNGRHTEALAKVVDTAIGIDVSRGLLEEARERRDGASFDASFLHGSATAIPIGENTVELGLYVATIHHLRPRDTRIASLDELERVLAGGGTALVSAWSTEHDQFDAADGFDTMIDWTLPDGETIPRFYHIYAPGEFEADIKESNLELVNSYVSSGNCYAEVRSQ